jgi:transcription termination factor Rho
MYDILELNTKLLTELREIAKSVNIKRVETMKKQDLIFKILDQQAIKTIAPVPPPQPKKIQLPKYYSKEDPVIPFDAPVAEADVEPFAEPVAEPKLRMSRPVVAEDLRDGNVRKLILMKRLMLKHNRMFTKKRRLPKK